MSDIAFSRCLEMSFQTKRNQTANTLTKLPQNILQHIRILTLGVRGLLAVRKRLALGDFAT
jgi:hypothetical protein